MSDEINKNKFKTTIPLLECDVYMFFGKDLLSEYIDFVNVEFDIDIKINQDISGVTQQCGCFCAVYVADKHKHGDIVHELSHCIDFCLYHTNLYSSTPCGGEIRARAFEFLYNKVFGNI